MIIHYRKLYSLNACHDQRVLFLRVFGSVMKVTKENILKCIEKRLDINWGCCYFLDHKEYEEYYNEAQVIDNDFEKFYNRLKVKDQRENEVIWDELKWCYANYWHAIVVIKVLEL